MRQKKNSLTRGCAFVRQEFRHGARRLRENEQDTTHRARRGVWYLVHFLVQMDVGGVVRIVAAPQSSGSAMVRKGESRASEASSIRFFIKVIERKLTNK